MTSNHKNNAIIKFRRPELVKKMVSFIILALFVFW